MAISWAPPPTPSPWNSIAGGLESLSQGVQQFREKMGFKGDMATISQAQPDPNTGQINFAELAGKMKTDYGRKLSSALMMKQLENQANYTTIYHEDTGQTERIYGGKAVKTVKPAAPTHVPAGSLVFNTQTRQWDQMPAAPLSEKDERALAETARHHKVTEQKQWQPQPFTDGKGKTVWVSPGSQVPEGFNPAKGGAGTMTPDAIENLADTYIKTGELPPMGFGPTLRIPVFNRVAEKMKQLGDSPDDLATRRITVKGFNTELARLKAQQGTIMPFARTAEYNLDLAEKLSGTVSRTGAPVVNTWLLKGKRSIAGDPNVAAFDAAVRTSINEYAKVTSSATGGGVTSDQARKDVENMLNAAQTPAQVKKVIETLKTEMENRKTGYEEQIEAIQKGIKEVGPGKKLGTGGTKPAPAGKATVQTKPGQVSAYVGPGKYNGVVITSEQQFNQQFGGQ